MIGWNEQLVKYCKEGIPKIIAGTKCDLNVNEEKKITNEEVKKVDVKEELKMKHFLTSALVGTNVDLIFSEIAQ